MGIDTETLNRYLFDSIRELQVDAEGIGDLVSGSAVLWMTMREGNPRLRIYYVLNVTPPDEADICQLIWLEVDPEWAASAGF